jgi:hypothetical protein
LEDVYITAYTSSLFGCRHNNAIFRFDYRSPPRFDNTKAPKDATDKPSEPSEASYKRQPPPSRRTTAPTPPTRRRKRSPSPRRSSEPSLRYFSRPRVPTSLRQSTKPSKRLHEPLSRTNFAASSLDHHRQLQPSSSIMALLLETTLGDLVIDLDVEGSPALCKNMLRLAESRFSNTDLQHSSESFLSIGRSSRRWYRWSLLSSHFG